LNRHTYLIFLDYWYPITTFLCVFIVAVALGGGMIYWGVFSKLESPAKKIKLITHFELKVIKAVLILILVGLFLLLNQLYPEVIRIYGAWFIVRLAISATFCGFIYYVITILIDVYFSEKRSQRLEKLRFEPRKSKIGNDMRLLSEDEEDVYLSKGMQAEEDVHSVDYDVWIDDSCGEVQIEQYPGSVFTERCPVCGYYTLKSEREHVVSLPTLGQKGQLMKIMKCHYCHHSERRYFSFVTSIKNESS